MLLDPLLSDHTVDV